MRLQRAIRVLIILVILFLAYRLMTALLFDVSTSATPEEKSRKKEEIIIPPVPAFDPSLSVIRKTSSGLRLRINNSAAVFKLDVVPLTPEENKVAKVYSADYISAMKRAKKLDVPFLPSVQLIDGKGKQFNDGLYAAIELYLQGRAGEEGAKRRLLRKLLNKLLDFRKGVKGFEKEVTDEAIVYVATGMRLGGQKADLPGDLQKRVAKATKDFRNEQIKSKPLGFYNWNKRLQQIFRQDRYYQKILTIRSRVQTGAAALISHIILNDPELSREHLRITKLYSRLTNPLDALTVQDYRGSTQKFGSIHEIILSPSGVDRFVEVLKHTPAYRFRSKKEEGYHGSLAEIGWALIPYSRSKETDLFNRVFGLKPLPPDIELMEYLIRTIKSGKIDLTAQKNSGWYDYQLHALETLLLPEKGQESKKLVLTAKYKERLKEAFKTMITKARETHVKTLRIPLSSGGGKPPKPEVIRPRLSVEPTATVYLRQARGYHFLKNVLPAILGEKVLPQLYRLRENDPPVEMNLKNELDWMMYLMYGMYAQACRDLGMKPELMQGELSNDKLKYARGIATEWLSNLEEDTDLKKDTRVIVPIHIDEIRKEVSYWATVGVRLMKIKVQYVYPPAVNLIKEDGREVPIEFLYQPGEPIPDGKLYGRAESRRFILKPQEYLIATDVFKELRMSMRKAPMTREEFRRYCDRKYGRSSLFFPILAVGVSAVILLAISAAAARRKRRIRGAER